jgi:uncharacterized protein DUF4349
MSRSSLRWLRRIGIGAAVLLVVGFAVGSLAGPSSRETATGRVRGGLEVRSASGTGATGVAGLAVGPAAEPYRASVTTVNDATGAGGTTQVGTQQTPGISDQVIKTADIGVEVRKGDIDRAWQRVFDVAKTYGGFVFSSSQENASGSKDPRSAQLVVRVPAGKFDQAVADLSNRNLGRIVRRGTSGQDVGQEFVDLNARLRNARSQESILLALMSRAKTVGDTIAVQQQLSQVQQQIEELTGRIRYLKDQTQLATIAVQLGEPGVFGGSFDDASFTKAWRTALDGLERMATAALIGGIWLGPFALLAAIALGTRRWRARPAPQVQPQA